MAAETPSGYTSGQLTWSGAVSELGPLIAAQIDKNAAWACSYASITADSTNAGPVFFGQDATTSASKWGFSLAASGIRVLSGGLGPANPVPIGRMYVFSAASATLHIEIFP
jgi:hypothetical protein